MAVEEVHPTHVDEHDHARMLRREGTTMALYATVCLFAALTVAAHDEVQHKGTVLKIIWGTTVGLAIAHWFAFRLTARLFSGGVLLRHDADSAVVQLLGSTLVAAVATVPVLLASEENMVGVVRLLLAGLIGLIGFAVAEASGASKARSAIYAVAVLVVGVTVALVKNWLSHH